MAKVTLAYHTSDLSADLTYAAVLAAATANKSFKPIEFFRPEKEHTMHTPPITGRGRKIEYILHSHYLYPMKIEPREFLEDTTKLPFLRNLWDANFIYLSWYDYELSTPAYTDFVEVVRGEKKFPISHEQGLVYLPVITFNFSGEKSV